MHPSSSPPNYHMMRHLAVRVLRAPVLAYRQCRRGGRQATLPGGEDPQAKRGKHHTLVPDLILFFGVVGTVMFATYLLISATMQLASGPSLPPAPGLLLETKGLIVGGVGVSESSIATDGAAAPEKVAIPTPPTSLSPAEEESIFARASKPVDAAAAAAQGVKHDATRDSTPSQSAPESAASAAENERRRLAVRDAFKHAWSGYEQNAWGHDEVRPVTNAPHDSWGGFGASLVDGLDTAMLMGLDEEVSRARAHVAKLDFNRDFVASFFETTIRYLGGLLGAFELSRDRIYLEKAQQLADLLMSGFDASSTGMPKSKINLGKHASENQRWAGGHSILAEVGSVQLEMEYLSFHTGDRTYRDKARHVFELLDQAPKDVKGLYPTYIDPETARFANAHISFGSFGDSFYEYLLKLYMLTDRRDQDALRMYNEAMAAMESRMIKKKRVEYVDATTREPVTREFAFLGELVGGAYVWKMEHLTCFMPGLLALGVSLVADEPLREQFGWTNMHGGAATNTLMKHDHAHTHRGVDGDSETAHAALTSVPEWSKEESVLKSTALKHASVSTALLETCVAAYTETATGLAPDVLDFRTLSSHETEEVLRLGDQSLLGGLFRVDQSKYILRPETLESIFVMWRLTGDQAYRDAGWTIFENLVRSCKTPGGFSAIRDVDKRPPSSLHDGGAKYRARDAQEARQAFDDPANWLDSQESFFFAETLKYLYLLFSPNDLIPLDKYVFNTEAHPLGILVDHDPPVAPVA